MAAYDEPKHFALKRFFRRSERDDFANERNVLNALSAFPHKHIVPFLSAWTFQDTSYMLFSLASGDLYHFLRETPPPKLTKGFASWLLEQTLGLCDAIKYLHNYEIIGTNSNHELSTMLRIGFHHDLKPSNILLYGADMYKSVWKIGDFGSGAVKYVDSSSRESIYNRKASTGDPIYSAPEYMVEGRVSRPKDIWSLGCLLLEVLIWALDSSSERIDQFQHARIEFSNDTPDHAPTYWCQDRDGLPSLNPAVILKLDDVGSWCKDTGLFGPILEIVRQMLDISPRSRPTAVQLCQRFQEMLQLAQSRSDGQDGIPPETSE